MISGVKPLDVCKAAEKALAKYSIPGGLCLYTRKNFVHVDTRTTRWRGQDDGNGAVNVTGWAAVNTGQASASNEKPSGVATDITSIAKQALKIIVNNEGKYGTVVRDDNGALSVGQFGWHASRALSLCKGVISRNQAKAKELLGAQMYDMIIGSASTAWEKYIPTTKDAASISALIDSPDGHAAQDALAVADVTVYIKTGMSYGLTDPGALIYFADGVNQYGTNSSHWKGVAQTALKSGGNVSAMLKATKANPKLAQYISRRERVYNAVVALGFSGSSSKADTNTPTKTTTGITYTVKTGDTLSAIALKYKTTYQKLAQYNKISNPNVIRVGQIIKIPG